MPGISLFTRPEPLASKPLADPVLQVVHQDKCVIRKHRIYEEDTNGGSGQRGHPCKEDCACHRATPIAPAPASAAVSGLSFERPYVFGA